MFDKNTLVAFGKDYVGTQIIAENNAITYKLTSKSSNKYSTDQTAFVAVNNNKLANFTSGMNVCKISKDGKLLEQKSFILGDTTGDNAFITYVKNVSNDCILTFTSAKEISPIQAVETFMASIGSRVWNHVLINRIKAVSYSAVYVPVLKKIALEGIKYGNEKDKFDYSVEIETVFDEISDIGRTGFPGQIVKDYSEYVSANDASYKKWPDENKLAVPLADYGLKPGDWVHLSALVFGSSELKDDSGWTRIDCRWIKGTVWKGSIYLENTLSGTYPNQKMVNADVWEKKETYGQIPDDVDGFLVIASKYNGKAGISKVKSLTLAKTTSPKNNNSPRQIGLNGIRTNTIVQEDIPVKPSGILSLLNMKDGSGKTSSRNFKEIKTGV
ncbi:hypothetical protein [Providencia phage PSTCR6]|nr:hypothetical protein [Providencia phage PSTCR6]